MDKGSTSSVSRVRKFLEVIARTGESALIYAPLGLKEQIFGISKRVFGNVKISRIESDLQDEARIDKIFSESLKEGSLLLVSVDKMTHSAVIRRLEQIFDEGYISVLIGSSWRKVEPVDTWKTIVWIDKDQIRDDETVLRQLFANKLTVDE